MPTIHISQQVQDKINEYNQGEPPTRTLERLLQQPDKTLDTGELEDLLRSVVREEIEAAQR